MLDGIYLILLEFTTQEFLNLWLYPLLAGYIILFTVWFIREFSKWR